MKTPSGRAPIKKKPGIQATKKRPAGRLHAKKDTLRKASARTQIEKKTGIRDLAKMTAEDAGTLLKAIGRKELDLGQITQILEIVPRFPQLVIESLNAVKALAETSNPAQVEAVRAIGKAFESIGSSFDHLALRAETDDARQKIAEQIIKAAEMQVELAKILERMNTQNNETSIQWSKLGIAVVSGLVMAFLGVGATYALRKDNET